MPSVVRVQSNTKKLNELEQSLKSNLVAKLGIFSDGNNRGEELTNAEIGARHEFGVVSEGLPRRSFLNDPLQLKRKEFVAEVKKIIASEIGEKNATKKILELMGIVGESIVQEAFETGGFGTWQDLSNKTIEKKKSESILIDTSQLRRSIISKVEKRGE